MPKLPVVSARKLIKALQRVGFRITSQKGSHIKMENEDGKVAIIPNHKEIKPGTLKNGILNPLGIFNKDLIELLDK